MSADTKHNVQSTNMSRKRTRTGLTFSFPRKRRRVTESKNALLIAKRALFQVNRMQRATEPKLHENGPQDVVAVIAGITTHLTNLPQGISLLQRIGNRVQAIFFEFSYFIRKDTVSTNTHLRVILYRDSMQDESTTPITVDVVQTAEPLAFSQRAQPKRFIKLYSANHILRTNMIAEVITVKRKVNFEIRWIGAAGGTIAKNGIFLLVLSNAAATEEPFMRFNWRLHFKDT